MNRPLLYLLIIVFFAVSRSSSAADWVPTKDDPLSLYSVSPRVIFSKWWADDRTRPPVNHFPAFRTAEVTSKLQQCQFDTSFVRLECSETLAGSASVIYRRDPYNSRLAKQLKAETFGAMSLVYLYSCTIGCGASVPKQFALMLYDGGD